MNDVLSPPMPPGCKPLSHQVAGHVHGKSKRKLGLLERGSEILKPVEATPIGERELIFYETLSNSEDSIIQKVKLNLAPFISNYYGLYKYENIRYLRLQNVCYEYTYPCVIDLKIGRQTWDPTASEADIIRKRNKYPPCEQLGFQITGFQRYYKVISNNDDGFGKIFCSKHEKKCLRQLSASGMLTALSTFFAYNYEKSSTNSLIPNSQLIESVLCRLNELYEAMKNQRSYLFYATSLLIIFESWSGATSKNCTKFNGFRCMEKYDPHSVIANDDTDGINRSQNNVCDYFSVTFLRDHFTFNLYINCKFNFSTKHYLQMRQNNLNIQK
ncbi:hypothetical protein GJ496_007478 [Pomphorhynchus laevis]|nr:hypothetical protein GJ496_007478 [Pomphorhynchus laevis]